MKPYWFLDEDDLVEEGDEVVLARSYVGLFWHPVHERLIGLPAARHMAVRREMPIADAELLIAAMREREDAERQQPVIVDEPYVPTAERRVIDLMAALQKSLRPQEGSVVAADDSTQDQQ